MVGSIYLRLRLIILVAGVLAIILGWATHSLRVVLRSCIVGQILLGMQVLRRYAKVEVIAGLLTLLIVHHAALLWCSLSVVWARRSHDDRVICVGLDMFLEILRTLESLAAELALVRLKRNVDSNMRGNVVALDCGGSALAPLTGQVEVVSRLATNMALADMLLSHRQYVIT
jgi:hypothetical protein